MISRLLGTFIAFLVVCSGSFAIAQPHTQTITPQLSFEPNRGQAPSEARYFARAAEGAVFLDADGFRVVLPDRKQTASVLSVKLVGANGAPKSESELSTGGVANYYRGSDRRNWLENVPEFGQVRYRNVYPGIDLLFHGRSGRLEYDFAVSPGANTAEIQLEFPGDQSATMEPDGSLNVFVQGTNVRLLPPQAFQGNGREMAVSVRFRLIDAHHVAFDVGQYDHARALLIDPVVQYTTIIGLSNSTDLNAMTVDGSGSVFLTGSTSAANYPNTGSPYTTTNPAAMYVTKLDPTGTKILYSTVLSTGSGTAIALDASGNAYVSGLATSASFPTTSQTFGTCSNLCGFAAKFDSTGQLSYSTLLATGYIVPKAITVTGDQALITGFATDATLQTTNAYQPLYTGQVCTSCSSPFLVKLNSAGTAYEVATYFGSGGTGGGIAVDPSGDIYIAGLGPVPMVNPLDQTGSLFVSEFSPDGQKLLASTYFGAGRIAGLVAGKDGAVYVAGDQVAADFPFTLNAFHLPQYSADSMMFATAFTPGLTGEKFSTYLGQGFANAIAIDSSDHIYIAGSFGSEPIPLKGAVVSDLSRGGFVMSLDGTGALTQSTQFGGHNAVQNPTAVAVDSSGNVYIAGINSTDTTTSEGNILDPVNVGTGSAYSAQANLGVTTNFVGYSTWAAKISPSNQPQVSLSYWAPYLVLRDAGSVDLSISSLTCGGTRATAGNCGATIPAGTACILNCSGQVSVTSNAQPSVQTFSPNSPQIANQLPLYFVPERLYFAPQQQNTTSAPKAVKVWNVSSTGTDIQSIRVLGGIQMTHDCPSSLASNAYCTFTVSASPTASTSGGGIQINLASGNVIIYSVSTLSTPSSALLPSMTGAYFGPVPVGKSSLVRTVAMTNASSSAMAAPTAIISGDAGFNVIGTTCNAPLAPQQSCGIAVQYTPSTNADASAKLNIVSGNSTATVDLSARGLIPSTVSVYPLQLDFYHWIIGGKGYYRQVTLTNTGATASSVTGITFSSPIYSETDDCAPAIAPKASCTINVTAAPQEVGASTATMTVTFDNAATQQIAMTMDAVLPVSTSITSADFGDITPVGVDSNPIGFFMLNNANSPTSYDLAITGDFKFSTTCPNPLPANTGSGVSVIFHPTKEGQQQGTLTISIPGITAQQIITLTGSASTPGITISPASLAFPYISAKLTAELTLMLSNPQSSALTIPAPALSGANSDQFQVKDNCSTIAPNATCAVTVVFAPTKAGSLSATLTFQNGANPSTSIPIPLSGGAAAAQGFVAGNSSAYFGNLNIGATSSSKSIVVTNSGPVPLALPALTVAGINPGEFTVTPDASCASVPARGTCNINISFTPKATGSRSATITFDSLATNSETVELYVSGSGQDFKFYGISTTQIRSIMSGATDTSTYQLNGETFFSGVVNLSCNAVGASYGPCTVTPSSVNLTTSLGWSNFTVTIGNGATAQFMPKRVGARSWLLALALLPCGFLLSRGRTRRYAAKAGLLLLLICLASCGGGGGSGGGPTVSTYTYTVTATAATGTASHSFNIQLNVQH